MLEFAFDSFSPRKWFGFAGPVLLLLTFHFNETNIYGADPASDEASAANKSDVVEFQQINMPEPATSMALSEDGKFLVVTHQADDSVTVWDAATRKLVTTLHTPSPRSVLCRGDGVFVANSGKGTISYFSAKKDWELVNQFELHSDNILHLSAGSSRMFNGQMLATCHGSKGSAGGVFLVDTKKDKVKAVGDYALASMSCDGKKVLTQLGFNQSPSGGISIYDLADFIGQKPKPITQGGIMQTPYVFQEQAGSFWIGDQIVFGGVPLQVIKDKDLGNIIIPDHSQRMIYPLTNNRIFARKLDTNLTEVGSRKVSFPKETASKFEGVYHTIYRRRAYLLDHPIAWTEGSQLRLFVFDINRNVVLAAVTQAFSTAAESVSDSENSTPSKSPTSPSASTSESETSNFGIPANILAGEKLSVRLKGPDKAVYQLLTGPDGMQLTDSGQLTWTPKTDNVGVHNLKIRVKDGKKISFERPSIEVLHRDMETPTTSKNGSSGGKTQEKFDRVELEADRFELTAGQGYRNLLLLQGDQLRVLDADGIKIRSDNKLPHRYDRILERDDHYIALALQPPQLDLIDKKSLMVTKSIPIEKTGVRVREVMDVAIHPHQPKSFVTIKHDVDLPSFRILVIDEAKGSIEAPEDLIGTWVKVDPAGNYLYAAYKDIYTKGSKFHINPGFNIIEVPQYGNIDWLITYELRGKTPKFREVDKKAGGNGYGIRMSADGKRVTYLSHVGTPMHSGNLLGWNPAKLSAEPVNYPLKGSGTTTQLVFHPTLNIVASPGSNSAVLLDRESGKPLEGKLQLTTKGLENIKVDDLIFSPDGKSLIFVCNAGPDERYLRRVGLRLSPEESATAATGVVIPVAKPATAIKQIDRAEFGALNTPNSSDALSHAEINRRFSNSVVLVKSDEGSGTGFIVGQNGYILTCAHVLPSTGDVKVTYQIDASKQTTVAAESVWQDDDQDIALLKIPTKAKLAVVHLAKSSEIDSGEEVTVIGNPGLGDKILTQTLTTGVVSNIARQFEDQTYIQTSAAVNPGSSGGPMFNSRGQIIGMVVLKANIEGTSFGIPASVLRQCLENLISTKK